MNNALVILNNNCKDIYVKWITKGGQHIPIFEKGEPGYIGGGLPFSTQEMEKIDGSEELKKAYKGKLQYDDALKKELEYRDGLIDKGYDDLSLSDAQIAFKQKYLKKYNDTLSEGLDRKVVSPEGFMDVPVDGKKTFGKAKPEPKAAPKAKAAKEVTKPEPKPEKPKPEKPKEKPKKVEKEAEGAGSKNAEIGNEENIDSYFGNGYDKWREGLSKGEMDGLVTYQAIGYRQMNNALRHEQDKIKTTEGLGELMGAMDRARAPKDMIVYRGVDDERFRTSPSKMKGAIITDKGFTSASLFSEVAERFMESETPGRPSPVLMKINVPKGAKAAELASNKFWGARKSDTKEEAEVLINRNAKMRVTNIRKSAGVTLVDMEVLLE